MKTTPSFITEMPLNVASKQEAELLSRFQASRQLYNACLNEAMERMELVRNSDAYKTAKKISREEKKKRSEAFAEARKAYRYSDYDLQVTRFRTISIEAQSCEVCRTESSVRRASRECWRFIHNLFYSENCAVSDSFGRHSH